VVTAGHRVAIEHPERALFVGWPPRPNGYMPDLLAIAPQTTLALVTDGPSTFFSTPDPLYSALERSWRKIDHVSIPTWPGRFDHLSVWSRRT